MKTKLQAGLTLLFVLSASILLTIYGAWFLYPQEIKALHLEQVVYMPAKDILYNFNVLMRYLTLPWETKLAMPSFSASASGLHHFEQVKWLFHLVQVVFLASLPAAVLFFKKVVQKGYGLLFSRFFLWAALAPIVIGCLVLFVGFDQFFTLFHQILFPGDSSWLFDPATDPVIYILPEDFFLHCFMGFFVCYEVLVLGVAGLCKIKPKSV